MASKQLWRWHGITGDGNAQDGMLWAESRALLLIALQQQMVTPLSLKRIAINSAQWRGDKSAESHSSTGDATQSRVNAF
ncbi:protein transport protein HofC [Escherichia coli]|nr:protein transport protein HofC [Escherichia coli]